MGTHVAEQRERVARALREAMTNTGVPSRTLAMLLERADPSVNEEKVANWRRGVSLLPAHLAQNVAEILGMRDADSDDELVERYGYDPFVMVRLYGLSPSDQEHEASMRRLDRWAGRDPDEALAARLVTIEELDLEIEEWHQELAEVERDRGVPSLVRSIIESGRYAAAIWPVFAGPTDLEDCRVHISDRVDLRRLDGRTISEKRVWADLRDALHRARALPSIALPRWSAAEPVHDAPVGRASMAASGRHPPTHTATFAERSASEEQGVSMWNVRRLDAPRPPRVSRPHHGLTAVAISATVSNTWLGYVASMLAYALGYGLTSTTDLGRHLHDPTTFNTPTELRNDVHRQLLRNPGDRKIWYHAATLDPGNPHDPWTPPDTWLARSVLHVRLVEDDDLLESTAEDRRRQPRFLTTHPRAVPDWKASRDAALDRMPDDDWHLRLSVRDAPWGSPAKWEDTVALAVEILHHIQSMSVSFIPEHAAVLQAHAQADAAGAAPVLRWLAARGAPLPPPAQRGPY